MGAGTHRSGLRRDDVDVSRHDPRASIVQRASLPPTSIPHPYPSPPVSLANSGEERADHPGLERLDPSVSKFKLPCDCSHVEVSRAIDGAPRTRPWTLASISAGQVRFSPRLADSGTPPVPQSGLLRSCEVSPRMPARWRRPRCAIACSRPVRTVRVMPHPSKRRLDALRATSHTNLSSTTTGAWMSLQDVCELLDESRSTLDKWRARGVFPSGLRKPNGRVMFRREDVADFIDGLEQVQ